jgi:predicted DNA-binding transcriptional regulator AlpA
MTQPTNNDDPNTLLVTLTAAQIRDMIREEIISAVSRAVQDDRLLDIDEAAKLLSVSPDWLYRNAKSLPFVRKLGAKMLRFSYQGIMKYLASRQATKN